VRTFRANGTVSDRRETTVVLRVRGGIPDVPGPRMPTRLFLANVVEEDEVVGPLLRSAHVEHAPLALVVMRPALRLPLLAVKVDVAWPARRAEEAEVRRLARLLDHHAGRERLAFGLDSSLGDLVLV